MQSYLDLVVCDSDELRGRIDPAVNHYVIRCKFDISVTVTATPAFGRLSFPWLTIQHCAQ